MGEPRPGQFVDNIFISVQQLKLKANEVGSEGDLLIKDVGGFWRRADSAGDVDIIDGFAQSRVDFDTTGLADGAVSIEAFASPSYIYAVAGGFIKNGAPVILNVSSTSNFDIAQTFVEGATTDFADGAIRGKFSRLSTDSAGNNDAALEDIIIVKLGVN